MAILFTDTRRNLGRNQTREYGPFAMPAGGYTRLRVGIDLIEAQRSDQTRQVSVDVYVSFDAGQSWVYWFGAMTRGSTTRPPEVDSTAWVESAAPPVGTLIRAVFTSGPDNPASVGIIVEGFV